VSLRPRWFRRRSTDPGPREAPLDVLDQPLLQLSPYDVWSVRDACEGCQIFGGTGSGKTSGSGQALALGFLRAGFGGLVCTAKPDERALWERYCEATGRQDSLIVFSPSEPHRFNFLDYEARRPGGGAGLTENLVQLFLTVLEVADRKPGKGAGDEYWHRTLQQLLRNAFDLLLATRGRLSLPEIYQLIMSAPQSPEDVHDSGWQASSLCFQLIEQGEEREKPEAKRLDFELTARYWLTEYPALAAKTRSIIVSSFTSMADAFLRGTLRELFCTETNIVPELTHEGAIIVLDLPIKDYAEIGQFAQILFKLIWQRSTERRNTEQHPNPVFLWADESQYFVTSHDQLFQTTARSARACTVYLTQNLSNYYAALGGESTRAEADSLLGNLQTKIFHANGDHVTNTWAADLFAKSWQFRGNFSSSRSFMPGQDGMSSQQGSGVSQALEWDVIPQEFTTLRKGGPQNDLNVDALIFQGGRIWGATGSNCLRTSFLQMQQRRSK
jgi:type IV secretory pathway TraG/TraD family ATPase VirD4